MEWQYLLSYFFGGVFLTNAVPHFVSGVLGRAFQSPFGKPPGVGLSSSTSNFIWGFFNFVVGFALLCRIGSFDPKTTYDISAFGLGVFVMGLFLSRYFGKFHGGNSPD